MTFMCIDYEAGGKIFIGHAPRCIMELHVHAMI